MGTAIRIDIACSDNPGQAECNSAFATVARVLEDVDRGMSTYHESDLTRVAQASGTENFLQTVTADTLTVLTSALDIAQKSEGLFDPTIGPYANYRKVKIANGRVGLTQKGMRLDFGGIAKGFALDKAAKELRNLGHRDFSFNFGGQVLAAEQEIATTTYDPRDERRLLLRCKIQNASLSVSGQGQRFTVEEGKRRGHLINPKSGQSEERNLLSVVYHPSAMLADAWSTALFFADARQFGDWTTRYNLAAWQLTATGDIRVSTLAARTLHSPSPCRRGD